jgi:excisionase family DNA binding protein
MHYSHTIGRVDETWFTPQEIADRLKVSPFAVRRWIREGRLRAVLLGGKKTGYRIRESDLNAFLKRAERDVGDRDG